MEKNCFSYIHVKIIFLFEVPGYMGLEDKSHLMFMCKREHFPGHYYQGLRKCPMHWLCY